MSTLAWLRIVLIPVVMTAIGCSTLPSASQSPDAAIASAAPASGGSGAPIGDDAPIGSWTQTTTEEDLRAAGFTETGLIDENVGTAKFTIQPDGTWTMAQTTTQPVRWPVFRGTYSVTAPGTLEMRTTFPSEYAGEVVTVEWSRVNDGLRFRLVSPPDPLLRVQFEAHTWAPSP